MDEYPPAGWYPNPDDPDSQRYWDGQKWTNDPTPAGWYPDTTMPGTHRYWNGQEWSDHVAPAAGADGKKQTSVFTQARVIALGILMAVGILWVLVGNPFARPTEVRLTDCTAALAREAQGVGSAPPECDVYR